MKLFRKSADFQQSVA